MSGFVMAGVARDDAEEGGRVLGTIHSEGFGVYPVCALSAEGLCMSLV